MKTAILNGGWTRMVNKAKEETMDLHEAFQRRRTCRDFTEEPVDDAALLRIFGAAFYAPINDHLRQFEFVVVQGHAVAV